MGKMREEFELWFQKKIDSLPLKLSLTRYDGGLYVNDFAQLAWMSWVDSRASLYIDLPKTPEFSASDEPDLAFEYGVDVMKEIIEAKGVKCK